jgi:hypothetical protein
MASAGCGGNSFDTAIRSFRKPVDFDFLPDGFEFEVFPFLFGTAFLNQFLHDGFFAGLQFEDAAKGINVLSHFGARHFLPICHERDCAPEIRQRQFPSDCVSDCAFKQNSTGFPACLDKTQSWIRFEPA